MSDDYVQEQMARKHFGITDRPTDALLEAAKVLYEAGAEYQIHGKPAPWEMLGSHTRVRLIEQARALLKWELTREPSERMVEAGGIVVNDQTSETWWPSWRRSDSLTKQRCRKDASYIHRAMSRARLTELGIEG